MAALCTSSALLPLSWKLATKMARSAPLQMAWQLCSTCGTHVWMIMQLHVSTRAAIACHLLAHCAAHRILYTAAEAEILQAVYEDELIHRNPGDVGSMLPLESPFPIAR